VSRKFAGLSHILGRVSTSTARNLQVYCRSPLLLAIIAHSLARGKLFFTRSRDSLLRRDVRRRGLRFGQTNGTMHAAWDAASDEGWLSFGREIAIDAGELCKTNDTSVPYVAARRLTKSLITAIVAMGICW
jgi:hypothetical protein